MKFLGGACFPAKTPIYTIHGLKPIEAITVKDTVYSYDETAQKYTLNKVKQTFKKTATQLVMLYALGGKLIASPTPEHPFFVKNTYKPAKELVKGDSLLSKNQGYVIIEKTVVVDSVLNVYNFEVENDHNYLVGEEEIVVHNTCNFIDVATELLTHNPFSQTVRWGGGVYQIYWTKVGSRIQFGDRSLLAKILGNSGNIEAHHIIPWTAGGNHSLVQLAAEAGFHLNDIYNGIGLEKFSRLVGTGLHGNHPAYDKYVTTLMTRYEDAHPGLLPLDASKYLQEVLIPDLKTKISNAKTWNQGSLNDYFRTVVLPGSGIPYP